MRRSAVAVCLFLLAASLSAATFDLPSDRDLLDRADLVVVGTVLGSTARAASGGLIYTDHDVLIEQVLKGTASPTIVISEAGGFLNGRGTVISGTAEYSSGQRVLTFLRRRPDGTYYTAFMALGVYRFAGKELVRDANGIEALEGDPREVRPADAFLDAIRDGDPERAPFLFRSDLRDATPASNAVPTATSYLKLATSGGDTHAQRWPGCDSGCLIGYFYHGSQPGIASPTTSIANAMDVWNDDPNSAINFGIGSQELVNDDYDLDGQNLILLSWATGEPSFCNGGAACGIAHIAGPTHNFDSEEFWTIAEGDVIVRASLSPASFERVVAHELGHTIGFRHSNETGRTPFTTNALMNSVVPAGLSLRRYDRMAAAIAYGNGYPCETFVVNIDGGGSVPFGDDETLTANTTGPADAGYTYQWYEGETGDTTTPVSTAKSFTTPDITTQRKYWVRVTIDCGNSANSVTVVLTPAACNEPVITTHTQSHRINPNATTTLQLTVNGTSPLTTRWYRSNVVGDTSNLVASATSFTTPSLTETTSYWARVSNNCGQADTALIIVTVGTQCVPAAITSQSPSLTVQQGNGATISVVASGDSPFTYQWYEGEKNDETKPIAGATGQSYAAGPFNDGGEHKYWAKVTNACGSVNGETIVITVEVPCPDIQTPLVSTPAISHFSNGYTVSWIGNSAVSTFEVQEATDAAFTQNLQTFNVTGSLHQAIAPHLEIAVDTRFYYRVRASSTCQVHTTSWSNTASTVVTRPLPETSEQFAFSVPVGSTQPFTQNLLVPGFGDTATNNDKFEITVDVPWMTVFPATGALSAGGTTVQLTINPTGLEVGSTTGTIQVVRTPGASAKGIATHDGPVNTSLPLGLSLVTPVSPDPRDGNPPPGTLIVPAVAHAQGIGSPFRSDVRIVNVSFSDIDYDISYTPSQLDGTQTGKKTTVTIRAGDVLALDDLVASWFGAGMLGEGGIGTVEIRPLNAANPLDTFASSRTYALTGGGTLGQFIPALRTNQFIGNFAQDSLARISLQQIAANAEYRTNVGFVEGTGSPVSFLARLVDGSNNVIQTANLSLPAFGHLQRSVPDLFGATNLQDGRVEVEVTSAGGKVSAYASVLNNLTNDPLMVFPVQPARTTAERYVLAGIAEFTGGSNFHSDMRIYNAGASAVTATLNFHSFGSETPNPQTPAVQITLNPGQVRSIDDVLPTLWPGFSGGGSIIATTPGPSSLVLTAQTFSLQPDGGTKGQFIPGVTFREATGLGERPLEVLQLEQSESYRSNVGFVEVTGKPVTIEVTAFEQDTKTSRSTQIHLKANEYVQYARMLTLMGLGTVYNGRVSVKVTSGEGRVYAYGSNVDNRTEDPTYVPAQ